MAQTPSATPDDLKSQRRREFLYIATGACGAVGIGAAIWPLIDALNPSADVRALATVEVDLTGMAKGERITVKWHGKPIFVWRRAPAAVEAARATPISALKDPVDEHYEDPNHPGPLPATDANRSAGKDGEWLIVIGICTHLGCVPLGQHEGDPTGKWHGWFCPCHGSQYDTSGRIRSGPAPRNLDIPRYHLSKDLQLKIG